MYLLLFFHFFYYNLRRVFTRYEQKQSVDTNNAFYLGPLLLNSISKSFKICPGTRGERDILYRQAAISFLLSIAIQFYLFSTKNT